MNSLTSWDFETDVVVVGYGGAGATSAIAAHDSGAKVIILEKMPSGGGTTSFCGGIHLEMQGPQVVDYIANTCMGTTSREMVERFVEESAKNQEWLKSIGGEIESRESLAVTYPLVRTPTWPNIPGGEQLSHFNIKRSGNEKWFGFGGSLFNLLSANVASRGIQVMTETPARELITNDQGVVIGVRAEKQGEIITIKAKKAVILTSGGFQNNKMMIESFLTGGPYYSLGNPGNTGDGIILAQKVGAALWHMSAIVSVLSFKAQEYESAFSLWLAKGSFIYVDSDGNRFADEAGLAMELHEQWRLTLHFDASRPSFPRIPTYIVFDDTLRKKGPLSMKSAVIPDYEWSQDNSKEIEKGWIIQGNTIKELAREISVKESALKGTVNKYNSYCKSGQDLEFGRRKEYLEPIEDAPYYAIKLYPCVLNTQGGPLRDEEARVLDYQGTPISRLYSNGELGSLFGFLYEAGGNLSELLAFGRISGRNAAAEKPWC